MCGRAGVCVCGGGGEGGVGVCGGGRVEGEGVNYYCTLQAKPTAQTKETANIANCEMSCSWSVVSMGLVTDLFPQCLTVLINRT